MSKIGNIKSEFHVKRLNIDVDIDIRQPSSFESPRDARVTELRQSVKWKESHTSSVSHRRPINHISAFFYHFRMYVLLYNSYYSDSIMENFMCIYYNCLRSIIAWFFNICGGVLWVTLRWDQGFPTFPWPWTTSISFLVAGTIMDVGIIKKYCDDQTENSPHHPQS